MPSETTICNLALGKLGEGTIIALDEESPEARVCRLHYEETRDEVLRSHRWNFAIKREHLVRNVTPPVFGWNFRYELPTDCLRVLDVCGWDVTKRPGHWEIEGRFVVSNDEDADARYIWRVVDCNLFDALFIEAIVLKLASKIARPINGSAKMSQELLGEYEKLTAGRARRMDSFEGNSLRRPAWQNSDLVTARFIDAIS